MTITHVAFRSSTALHTRTDTFIEHMQGGASKPRPEDIEAIMSLFIEESLAAFMLRAAQAAGLPSGLMKVVNMTSQTIQKSTSLVVSRSARKMDLSQNQAAADYMAQIRKQDNNGDWYVAFPVDHKLASKGRGLPALCEQDDLAQARLELQTYLLTITDEAIHWYFEKPMALLKFGPVLRKLASVGLATTRKASRSLIQNLIPKLDEQQLAASCQYQASMLMNFP